MQSVKKVAKRHFFEFSHSVLAPMARSAPNAKYENLWVFIRSDAHVVRAGLNIRGCGPLSTPGFFDRLKCPAASRALFIDIKTITHACLYGFLIYVYAGYRIVLGKNRQLLTII